MRVSRLRDIPGFNIDRMAAAVGDDPGVLRMEAGAAYNSLAETRRQK